MPNIYDIYLGSYHLHSLSTALPTAVSQSLQGIESPSVRLSSYDNPGAHGQTISNALYGSRVITITGRVKGSTVDEYRANRVALAQACTLRHYPDNHELAGHPMPVDLQITVENGPTYAIPVVVSRFQNPDQFPTWSSWQLELTATQWYFEATSGYASSVGLPQPGGSSFPWIFPLQFGGSSGGSVYMTNVGTTTAYPTITLTGPVTNPVISNSTTGQYLSLNISLVSGDSLVIDTKNHTITQGGSTNKIGALVTGSSFWGLAPGENLVTYSANQYDTSIATIAFLAPTGGL